MCVIPCIPWQFCTLCQFPVFPGDHSLISVIFAREIRSLSGRGTAESDSQALVGPIATKTEQHPSHLTPDHEGKDKE